jgi:hypothetical protein
MGDESVPCRRPEAEEPRPGQPESVQGWLERLLHAYLEDLPQPEVTR